jgi:translation initiation factor 5B
MAKKDKKKAKQDDYWDTQFQDDAAAVEAASPESGPSESPVIDELAEQFGGLMSAIKKSKGGKKDKKGQGEMVDANEEIEALEGTVSGSAVQTVYDENHQGFDDGHDGVAGEFRVKTKKEKEKEKKEKEKAKKKAQAFSALYIANVRPTRRNRQALP